jgi:hypothetical protein
MDVYVNIYMYVCLCTYMYDHVHCQYDFDHDDDDDVYSKKIITRVSQNLILHKNADHPKA